MRSRSPRRVVAILITTGLGCAALALGACQSPGGVGPQSVAEVYLEAGRHQDAAREAEVEIRREPANPHLRIVGARAHAGLGNTQRAIDHLEVALGLSPSDPEISVLLGEIEQSRENLPDAYVAFRRASKLDPNEIRAWSGLALSAEALGFEEEAADAYERWAELEQEQGFIP